MNNIVDYSAAGFIKTFDKDDERGYVSINMEMYRDKDGLKGTGRYCVYCLYPISGSCYFTMEMNKNGKWNAPNAPFFIDQSFINWIAQEIISRNF